MTSRQLSNSTLDRLEASLSRFYLQGNSSSIAVTHGSSGSSKGNQHHGFKLVATETKVVQETTHRELVLESSYGDSKDSDGGDSGDAREQNSHDEGPGEQVCNEVPSGGMVGYAECSPQDVEKEYHREEEQGNSEQYEGSSGYGGGYDGGYELDSYGGQSDYDGYYSQGKYGDYY